MARWEPDNKEQAVEQAMVDAGRQRVVDAITKAEEKHHEHTVAPWKGMVPALVVTSMEHLAKAASRRGTHRAAGIAELMSTKLDPEQIFLIGATASIEGICRQERLQWVVRRIARFLEAEVRMREFAQKERKQYKRLEQAAAERASTNLSKRMATFNKAARRATYDSEWADWTYEQSIAVGNIVVGCMLRGGLLEKMHIGSGKKQRLFLRLTPAGQELLESREEFALEMAKPAFRPMVERPLDWSKDQDGGYHDMGYDTPLVKSHRAEDVERFANLEMPAVYQAINAIQSTPWRVNEDIKVVAQELMAAGGGRAGLPSSQEVATPEKPVGLWDDKAKPVDLPADQKVHLDAWLKLARAAYNAEAGRSSKHTQAIQILRVAEDYTAYPAVYFPHSLDWRGRCYPIPSQLNPQGTDLAKGLLCFAEARPLGDMGPYWLAVHGANCWGVDKAPLNERVDWVCDNDDLIARIASDPLEHREWEEADEPFQFLAFCLEWAEFVASGEDPAFESRLPVAMDGSCNGLQHFSALLRDPVGAKATNLVPCDTPNDIYTQVAEGVTARVEAERHGSDGRIAQAWLAFGVSRKVVKRQVMTTPYGVTAQGGLKQLLDEMQKQGAQDQFEDLWGACKWLSPIVFDVIGEVVQASRQAQEFLTKLARATAKNDKAVVWASPSGFEVWQEYLRADQFLVKSKLVGNTLIQYQGSTKDLDKGAQTRGISPNFVHSYDAAHLALTVVECGRRAGRELSWAAVHDSFGTHAGDVDLMQQTLRQEFVRMYEGHDPLAELLEAVAARVPEDEELPELPCRGSFDLSQVLKAEFFFA